MLSRGTRIACPRHHYVYHCCVKAEGYVRDGWRYVVSTFSFFFQAEDGIRDIGVTGVQTCALLIYGLYALQKLLVGFRILTINGEAEVVVQDAEAYKELLERVETIEGIQRGPADVRSEERRVGKESRSRWSPYQ